MYLNAEKLDDILRKLFERGMQFEEDSNIGEAENSEEAITITKSQIIKWIEEEVIPKEKYYDKETTNDYAQYSFQGFNQCIFDMQNNLKGEK